jgi:glycosyltransferase involved in cell wall biosynthesis
MQILIVTPLLPPEPGGPAQYSVKLAAALEAQGDTVVVLGFTGVRTYPSGIRHLLFFWQVWRSLRGQSVAIVLDTLSVALPTVLAAWLRGVPVVIRTGGDFVWERYVERTGVLVTLAQFYLPEIKKSVKDRWLIWLQRQIIFPLTHTLVFSTKWQYRLWYEPYRLIENKTAFIDNSFHYEINQAPANPNGPLIWIGRDIVLKNVALLDRAVVTARAESGRDIPYQKYSNIPHAEVQARIAEASVVAIPSISEISPNLAMEALAQGVPVLLTQECGLAEFLAPYVTLVDPTDEAAVAEAIRILATETGYQAARVRAVSFGGVSRSYHEVAADFRELINSRVNTK